jgi:hypothetical protein
MSLRVTGIVVSSLGIAVLLAACSANPLSVPVGVVTTVAEDRPVSDAGSDLRIKTEILKGFAEEAKGLLVDASVDVYQGQVPRKTLPLRLSSRLVCWQPKGSRPSTTVGGVSTGSSIFSAWPEVRKNWSRC